MFDLESHSEGRSVRLAIRGDAVAADCAAILERVRTAVRRSSRVELDLSGVEAMDSLGAAAVAAGVSAGAAPDVEVALGALSPAVEPFRREFETRRVRTLAGYAIGRAVPAHPLLALPLRAWAWSCDFAAFVREAVHWVLFAPLAGRGFKFDTFFDQVRVMGVEGLSITVPLGFIMGAVIAAIGGIQLEKFGALIYVADLVAVAIPMVIGPMITAILVAGRSGSSIAAEIGTMVVNEEIDALRAMGYHPGKYVTAPRLVALLFAMPILVVLADLAGLLGGAAIGLLQLDFHPSLWIRQTTHALKLSDTYFGLLKGLVYAALIGLVSVHAGLRVERSAEGVGRAARGAVVTTISLLIVGEGVMDVVYSVLKSRIPFLAMN